MAASVESIPDLSILQDLSPEEDAAERARRPTRERVVHASDPALSTRALSVHYRSVLALRDVWFTAPRGQITSIIGPSGCGKSTLLRSLNRINDQVPGYRVEGQVVIGGRDVLGGDIDVTSLRRRVGMLFQRPNPFPMSIYDNVVFGMRVERRPSKAELDDAVERCLTQTALWDEVKGRLRHPATGLSGGQQQRLCLARTLAAGSEIILMDEPCAALDPITTIRIEELMRTLRGEVTIIIVTHNLQQAIRVSDYTAFILMGSDRAGELIEMGRSADVFNSPVDKRTEDYIRGRFG